MPVHNTERYVARAVQSILDQTFANFELIIIDDGSTDGSQAILERYAARDQRIRLFSRACRGIPRTRQELLTLSVGKYYAMMDSDDESEPTRLEKQLAYLEAHPECVCVTCQMLLTDPEGNPIRTINLETTHEEIDAANLSGRTFFVNGAYMIRRTILLEIGGIRDFPLACDLDVFLRLAERGRLAGLSEALYKYRQHLTNSTLCWEELNRCVARAVHQARARRGLPQDSDAVRVLPGAPLTRLAQQRKWAWWALAAGQTRTARKHALAALRCAPLSLESWRLLVCAARGH